MKLGEIIRTRRKQKGWTLQSLATLVKCSKGYLSGIENAKVNPPMTTILTRICRQLELDVDALNLLAYVEKAPEAIRHTEAYKKLAAMALDVAVG